jgi:hypothetical protein
MASPRLWLAALTAGGLLVACNGKKGQTTISNKDSSGAKIDGSLCETKDKRVVAFDLNKDGKEDVWKLYAGDVFTCKQVDFDHDGRKDWIEAYNPAGQRLYNKADLDYDGKFDMLAILEPTSGETVEAERDTDFDGKFDVREVYASGQLTAVRRDRNGDSRPDMWENYADGQVSSITYDDDFDGKVDRRDDKPAGGPPAPPPTEPAPAPAPTPAPTGSASVP